jgi:hypothetical protein
VFQDVVDHMRIVIESQIFLHIKPSFIAPIVFQDVVDHMRTVIERQIFPQNKSEMSILFLLKLKMKNFFRSPQKPNKNGEADKKEVPDVPGSGAVKISENNLDSAKKKNKNVITEFKYFFGAAIL